MFTDLALRWAKPGGIAAYVTPTSFLSGEYFKDLRLFAREARPTALDFVSARKGVFEACYRKQPSQLTRSEPC